MSQVARNTGLTRATARRLLLTLCELGYLRSDGREFELTPQVLEIGYSYVASLNLNEMAQPYLEALSTLVDESSSVSVLDDTDIVYVARVPTKRIMTVAIGLGSRFPAYQTSMGRVLLAALEDEQILDIYERSDRSRATERTVTSAGELLDALGAVRRDGWALVDQELEVGVVSIAAPLIGSSGATVAAMNVSTAAARTPVGELRSRVLPRLLETSRTIGAALSQQ